MEPPLLAEIGGGESIIDYILYVTTLYYSILVHKSYLISFPVHVVVAAAAAGAAASTPPFFVNY